MVFEVPASKATEPENRFEFKIGDETFSVPKLAYLTGEVIEMLAEAEEHGGVREDAAQYALFGPADTEIGRAVRKLDTPQLGALIEAYREASSISVGESSASTDS